MNSFTHPDQGDSDTKQWLEDVVGVNIDVLDVVGFEQPRVGPLSIPWSTHSQSVSNHVQRDKALAPFVHPLDMFEGCSPPVEVLNDCTRENVPTERLLSHFPPGWARKIKINNPTTQWSPKRPNADTKRPRPKYAWICDAKASISRHGKAVWEEDTCGVTIKYSQDFRRHLFTRHYGVSREVQGGPGLSDRAVIRLQEHFAAMEESY